MEEDSFTLIVLGTDVEGDLEATSGLWVSVEVVLEGARVALFDLLDRFNGVTPVASASTVLELNHVRSVPVAKDLSWH